jgi:hypothetical protein
MKSFSSIASLLATGMVPTILALPHQGHDDGRSHYEHGHQYSSKRATTGTIALRPHVEYDSSMGVIGCLINTNRIAYWPLPPPCDNPCVKLTAPNGNTINVLHIDKSTSSYDISMDAFKTLKYGADWRSVNTQVESEWEGVQYEYVSMDQCAGILPDGTLPLIAKSTQSYDNCVKSEPQSFWAKNSQFWDVDDGRCLRGKLQKCELVPGNTVPQCADGAGAGMSGQKLLTGIDTVVDITEAGVSVPAVRPPA